MYARDSVLKEPGSAIVIGVRVGEDHVLDFVDVQTQFLHAADDLVVRGIVVKSFEEDDPPASDNRPGVVDPGAEKVQVVRSEERFCVPCIAGRRTGGL